MSKTVKTTTTTTTTVVTCAWPIPDESGRVMRVCVNCGCPVVQDEAGEWDHDDSHEAHVVVTTEKGPSGSGTTVETEPGR